MTKADPPRTPEHAIPAGGTGREDKTTMPQAQRSFKPKQKLKLPPGEKPTAEKRERHGPRKEPSSPTSNRPRTVGERFLQAAKKSKLLSYDKLKEGQIRILIVNPAEDPKAQILVLLDTVSFEDLPQTYEFEALSYHWGDGDANNPIFILEDEIPQLKSIYNVYDLLVNRKRLYVKPNLYKALQHFRRKDCPIALWVDAICINQSDEEEKKSQVAMMARLYTMADRVCIWLGSADTDGRTDRAMMFIKDIVREYELDKLIKPETAVHWSNLVYLMRSSWFSRRWVIQELALAKDATVHCGEKEVHWRDFADAISLFVLHFEQIRKLFEGKQEFVREYNAITELDPLGAKILVDEIGNTFLKNADGTLYEPLKGLEALVSSLSTFDTSDPRDTIHALLNMAKETSSLSSMASAQAASKNPPPKPSYSKDLLEVYTDFVRWVILEYGSLDIICRQWALPPRKEKGANGNYDRPVVLPSWIQVAPDSAYGRQEEGSSRKNGDSFVGLPGARFYNASHNKSAQVSFGIDHPAPTRSSTSNSNNNVSFVTKEPATIIHDISNQQEPSGLLPDASKALASRPPPRNAQGELSSSLTLPAKASHEEILPDLISQRSTSQLQTIDTALLISQANTNGVLLPQPEMDQERLPPGPIENKNVNSSPIQIKKDASEIPAGRSATQPRRSGTSDSVSSTQSRKLAIQSRRDSSIYVTGFKMNEVTWRTDPIPDGVIPQKALQKLGWTGDNDVVDTVPDKVWRTLVADRGPDGRNPPSWYHRACLRCLVKDTPNGHINTHKLLAGEPPKIIKDYLKRVQAVTWNRVVLEAGLEGKEENLVGIGPPGTELGDIVCILFGCSVPCILRVCETDGDKQINYKLIGEAFIYGRMDGEAVTGITTDEIQAKTEEFRIM